MFHVSIEADADRWLRHAVRVYLEGEKNFPWISGVVRGSERTAVIVLLTTFGRFSATHRYRKLLKSLRNSLRNPTQPTVWVLHSPSA